MLTKQTAQEYLNTHPTFANSLAQLSKIFSESGLFSLLLENAKPQVIDPKSPNYHDLSAAETHRSFGYFQALEDVLNFRSQYLAVAQAQATSKAPAPDFGGTSELVRKGVITPKEANDLKRTALKHPAVNG